MPRTLTALILAALAFGPPAAAAAADDGSIDGQIDGLVGLYKDLHRQPEVSYKEVKTAARVAQELKSAGADVTTGVGGNGVVGVLKNGDGPVLLLRTDLDALPVKEETGLPYKSEATITDAEGKTLGVMHACGHDVHMTCLVGTARWLAAHRDAWSGTVLFVGQPAEEMIGGAKAMLADGLYERFPKPTFALALHVTHDEPAGTVGYVSGPALAGSTAVDVTIKGKGGHGAAPHTTVDPVVLAALAVLDLQTIASREVNPIYPCVVTVGSIHGGTKGNIIPNEVRLQLTLRAYRDDVRDQLLEGIQRRIHGLAQAHRAPEPSFAVAESTPPTVNTPDLVNRIVPVFKKTLGDDRVKPVEPVMGAEDFGLFGRGGVPTFMFRLGTIAPDRFAQAKAKGETLPSLHSASYYPEPTESIRTGVRSLTAAATELLKPGGR